MSSFVNGLVVGIPIGAILGSGAVAIAMRRATAAVRNIETRRSR